MSRFMILAVVIIMLCGCASLSRTQPLTSTFNPQTHEAFATQGGATVRGQAFQRTQGGEVRYAAGRLVELFPATSYGNEIISVIRSGKMPTGHAPEWDKLVRSMTADGQGGFEFNNVPAGEWYVMTSNWWSSGRSYGQNEGGYLVAKVTVPEDGEVRVMVTRGP
jgi:hypothetical protein